MKYLIVFCLCTICVVETLSAQSISWKENRRGNRYFSKQRYAEAVKCYDRALSADTTDARAYFNRGDAYLSQKNVEQAMQDYAKAARFEKNKEIKAMAFHNMGYVCQVSANSQKEQNAKQEALRQAIEYYKESLRNDPKDDGTRYNLALCQKQLRDSEQQPPQSQPQPKPQPQQQPPQKEERQQQQQQVSSSPKPDGQTQQLLNLSRQAEQEVRKRLNQRRAQRNIGNKNW